MANQSPPPTTGNAPVNCDHLDATREVAAALQLGFAGPIDALANHGVANSGGTIAFGGVVSCSTCGLTFKYHTGIDIQPLKSWQIATA